MDYSAGQLQSRMLRHRGTAAAVAAAGNEEAAAAGMTSWETPVDPPAMTSYTSRGESFPYRRLPVD